MPQVLTKSKRLDARMGIRSTVPGAHIALETTANAETRADNKTHEGAASLRDDLAAQLAGAQSELSANIIELRQSGASADVVAKGEIQLAALMGLQRKLEQATPATIASIRAEVASCVAAAAKIAQQAQTAEANSNQGPQSMSIAAASQAARAATASFVDDYYGKKKFDAYLHFTSAEDEEEFRRREEERREEIEKARALHTPEGDLLATKLSIEQMNDAGAHGASESSEFNKTLSKLKDAESNLVAAVAAQTPAAQNKKPQASAEVDPLDAIKPSLDASRDEIARLKAAGVIHAAEGSGHGVNVNQARQEAGQRTPT